jgi:hypothetical protein
VSGWHIDPGKVETVLTTVGSVAGVLSGAVDGLQPKAEDAIAGTASSGIIADAVGGFFEHHSVTLQSIGNRINAGVTGAVQATNAYLAGDETMAAEHQAAAATVAGTGGVGQAGRPGMQAQ